MQIRTIGLDIAKNVFQVHGIDTGEKVVVRKQLRRRQVLATVGTGCGFAIEMRPV
jgi:transposase